jgi:hypothetical protein
VCRRCSRRQRRTTPYRFRTASHAEVATHMMHSTAKAIQNRIRRRRMSVTSAAQAARTRASSCSAHPLRSAGDRQPAGRNTTGPTPRELSARQGCTRPHVPCSSESNLSH